VIWQLDLILLFLVIICAIAAITVKDLLSSAIIFGVYSFLMCLLWTGMGAVDVAFTAAVFQTTRRTKD
jgi:energy-converting hydrogenase B subunit D